MMQIIEPYILTFIAIFVAVDAIGNIPVYISLVEGSSKKQRNKIVASCTATATIVALLFMFVGKWIIRFIGITVPDFQIAGGLLLFIISVRLLMPGVNKVFSMDAHDKDAGVFPLGMPLITGPAVLTTTLMMVDSYGMVVTFVSLILNMLFVWVVLNNVDFFTKLMGPGGARAFSKIMFILLAAIGVMMVRRGIMGVIL